MNCRACKAVKDKIKMAEKIKNEPVKEKTRCFMNDFKESKDILQLLTEVDEISKDELSMERSYQKFNRKLLKIFFKKYF